jgi:carboxyl-terminal processing protease
VAKKEKSTVPLLRNTNNFLQHFKKRRNTVRQNQEEIKGLIIDEIIKRYQYQEGFINIIKTNSEIKKSVSILNDSVDYENILKI